MLGGMLSTPQLSMLVIPAVYRLLRSRAPAHAHALPDESFQPEES